MEISTFEKRVRKGIQALILVTNSTAKGSAISVIRSMKIGDHMMIVTLLQINYRLPRESEEFMQLIDVVIFDADNWTVAAEKAIKVDVFLEYGIEIRNPYGHKIHYPVKSESEISEKVSKATVLFVSQTFTHCSMRFEDIPFKRFTLF